MYVLYVNTLYHLKINEKDIYDSQIIKISPFFCSIRKSYVRKKKKKISNTEKLRLNVIFLNMTIKSEIV